MTRKQLILFFAGYSKAKAFTVERDKRRILVEVNEKFMPEDMKEVAAKIKRPVETVTMAGSCYLVIRF